MTATSLELCEALADKARPGEYLEVFARHVGTAAVRLAPDGRHWESADGWVVGVLCSAAGQAGRAMGDTMDSRGLAGVLDAARRIRRTAPFAVPLERLCADPAPGAVEAVADVPRPPREKAEEAVRRAADLGPVTATAAATHRTVIRCDSTGWRGSYTENEAQLHVRSAQPGLDAAQGARIRGTARELPAGDVVADMARARAALSAPPAGAHTLDRIWMSPMVTARIAHRLSRAFVRVPGRRAAWEVGTVIAGGPQRLVLVDDLGKVRPGDGTAFDDEGTLRQRTVLLERGRVAGLLGSRMAGPTTGSAHWGGWDSDVAPAVAACWAEPTAGHTEPTEADLAGWVLVAEELRGFRGGLDLTAGQVDFELTGAVLRDGERAGRARIAISARMPDLLHGVHEVLSGTEFYRVKGLYGGSWWSLEGAVARGER